MGMHHHVNHENSEEHHKPNSSSSSSSATRLEKLKLVAVAMLGFGLVMVSGLSLAGTVMSLAVVTPLLVLFSPVLVPAALVLSLSAVGFLISGGCGVAALKALTWLYGRVSRELARARTRSSFVQIGL